MTAVEQNTLKRRGVGMKAFDPERACPGFTLFAPLFVESRMVYLIDLQGKVVHTWKMPYSPGLSGYLTERGTLYYNGRYPEDNFLSRFPFKGGVALEADWSGKVLWEVRHPGQHHDGVLLRNGNVLLDCMGEVPDEIAQRVKGGMDEAEMRSGQYLSQPKAEAGKMYSSYFAELTPAGKTVWEWRTWDHLDPVADGIAEVQAPRTMWHQGNGLKELPDGDILASFRPTSTVIGAWTSAMPSATGSRWSQVRHSQTVFPAGVSSAKYEEYILPASAFGRERYWSDRISGSSIPPLTRWAISSGTWPIQSSRTFPLRSRTPS